MDGIDWATDLGSSFTRSSRTLAVHVADDRGNFLRLQMAYGLARPKTKLTSQFGSHARLFLRLAGHGRGKIPDPKTFRAQVDRFKGSSLAPPHPLVWRASAKILLGTVLLFGVAHLAHPPAGSE